MAVFIQVLLSVVILSLTVLLTAAGIQVFLILHEARQALKRINSILQNTDTLSSASAKPITAVNEFFAEVKRHHLTITEVPIKVIYTPYSRRKGQSNLNAINVLVKLLLRLVR